MDKVKEEYLEEDTEDKQEFMVEEVSDYGTIEMEEEGKDKDPNEPLKVRGIAAKGGIVNRNRRLYSTHVYTKAVEEAQGRLKEGRLLGRLDHPDIDRRKANLTDAAFIFTKLWMEGDLVKYEGRTLPTPKGKLLEDLLLAGVGVRVSTRGKGDVAIQRMNEDYVSVVQDNYTFSGIDFVLDPSNEYGGIEHFEDEEIKGGREDMTLEEMKVKYPHLVEEIKREARTDLEEETTAKFEKDLEEEISKAKEEIKSELEEDEKYKKYKALVEAVRESAGVEPTDEELAKKLSEAEEKAKELEKELAEAKAEKEKLAKEKKEREEQEKVEKAVEEAVEGYEYAEILKEHLAGCKTAEEVEEQVAEKKSLIESVLAKTGVKGTNPNGKGEGTIEEEEENDDVSKGEELSEEIENQKRLAGLL